MSTEALILPISKEHSEIFKYKTARCEGQIRIVWNGRGEMVGFYPEEKNDPEIAEVCRIIGGLINLALEYRIPIKKISDLCPRDSRTIPAFIVRIFAIHSDPAK